MPEVGQDWAPIDRLVRLIDKGKSLSPLNIAVKCTTSSIPIAVDVFLTAHTHDVRMLKSEGDREKSLNVSHFIYYMFR